MKPLLSLGILALATMISQAATPVTWTGNAQDNNWNTPSNWDTNSVPNISGADSVIINNGGTVTHSKKLDFTNGSDLTMTSGSSLTISGDFIVRDGATIAVESGSTLTLTGAAGTNHQFITHGGSTFNIGGTLAANGPSGNPLKAPSGLNGGGFNFTTLGAKMQFDEFTGSGTLLGYLKGKATNGFFLIDGTTVSDLGMDNAENGMFLKFTGSDTAGSLTLVAVPEPSSAALLGLGGLALILRRRK